MSEDNLTSAGGSALVSRPESNTKTHHRSGFYIKGIILHAVVFAAICPLVGGILFFALLSIKGSSTAPLAGYLHFFLVSIPMSYLIAAPAAALTGAIVATATIWISHGGYFYLFAAIVGGCTSSLIISNFFNKWGTPPSLFAVLFTCGALAAVVCTRVQRSFRLGAPAGAGLVTDLPAEHQ